MPRRRSWFAGANDPATDFPLENLPFGAFVETADAARPRIGIAIGDRILDLRRSGEGGLLDSLPPAVVDACAAQSLNTLMALGRHASALVRAQAARLLSADAPADARERSRVESCLVPMADAQMALPAAIGDYTDFYASIHHATNVGRLFRPDRPLPAHYAQTPLAYHGRASSIVPSGHAIRRPVGQSREPGRDTPEYRATASLDYEVEVGFLVAGGNRLGEPIALQEAEQVLFGACLVNDWSARDLQAWESQPLGPFLSKSFATTISPWVVSMDALEPFRAPAFLRGHDTPPPPPYLTARPRY